jgi:hypothetical protein
MKTIIALACLILSSVIFNSAFAQDASLPPRVLVIFDTSGSMLANYQTGANCKGDGSATYPHRNGCNNTVGSRLYHAKRALSQIVQNTGDIEFGLMRYGQLERGQANFGTRQTQVGYQYYNASDVVVSTNYDGSTNGCSAANLLEPPSSSDANVLEWLDGVENFPANKELRANGYTPLTLSLESAKTSLASLITQDANASCRSYYVLLLTDGYQQCPNMSADDPVYRAMVANELELKAEALRNLTIQGQRHDIRTFVVGFGLNNQFHTELDMLARAGGTAVNAMGIQDLIAGGSYQANDPQGLIEVLQSAIENARPRELCDNIDNDCDGRIDEDFVTLNTACRIGVGECGNNGVFQCSADGDSVECSVDPLAPANELCDNRDNDCDGRIDEGQRNQCNECGPAPVELCNQLDDDCDGGVDEQLLNECGTCGALPVEVCNNRDDDCDGRTDEGVLNACGLCGAVAPEVCDCNDNDCDRTIDEGLNCTSNCNCTPTGLEECDTIDNDCDNLIDEGVLNACGGCGQAPLEVCNGLDDDCDNNIDETYPEEGTSCGVSNGICMAGQRICQNGRLNCVGGVQAVAETCDSVDNDCDGTTDEGTINACGWCGAGFVEVCDNIDNDCDGTDDQGTMLCREGASCINGECALPCNQNECPAGLVCFEGNCISRCQNRECPAGTVCQNGECNDPCLGIICPEGKACSMGHCIASDCYVVGCPTGQVCTNHQCVTDPCSTANCGANQGCDHGRCFDSCDTVSCPTGSFCINGICTDNLCLTMNCPAPYTCENNQCVEDSCFEKECDTGFICEGGACIEDPCIGIICPNNQTCHRGICRLPSGEPVITVGNIDQDNNNGLSSTANKTPSGCDCDQQSSPYSLLLMVALLLLTKVLMRRRENI